MSETTTSELLAAIQNFLREDVLPQLDGFSAYNTRIAANSLGIVGRELALGGDLADLDADFAVKRGIDTREGAVTQQLALQLRSGDLQPDALLIDYLRQRTLISLQIDNPKYSGLLQARQQWNNEETP